MIWMCFIVSAGAQPISQQMGGIETEFTIISGDVDLNRTKQLLIRRAIGHSYIKNMIDGGAGWGYGYASLHLEFVSREAIQVQHFDEPGKKRAYYLVECFNRQGEIIAQIEMDTAAVREFSNRQLPPLLSYSIDLQAIPVVILDQTSVINIERHVIE